MCLADFSVFLYFDFSISTKIDSTKLLKLHHLHERIRNGRISIHKNRCTQKFISPKLIFVKIYLLLYIYVMCNYFSFLFGRSWLSTSFHEVVLLFFLFTSCISCKINNRPFHTNNIMTTAKLKNCWIVVSSTNTSLTSKILFKYVLTKRFC